MSKNNMNILIVEDEDQAAQRLEKLVHELLPEARVVARLDTVKKAVKFFLENVPPDLTLMDIQLADGISFEIFQQCEVRSPVIFTTAYDEYALRAFKVNSIDYILKPVDREEFRLALEKYRRLTVKDASAPEVLQNIQDTINMLTKKYKTRFVIKVGEHLRTIETRNVDYFYSQEKTTFCCTVDNRKMIIDFTLEQLEDMLDPALYFRINRKYLVSAAAINDIISYTNSRLRLVLKNSQDSDIIVAREKVQDFKTWLDK
jgi:DNA-binding LytR/AlgR family response regulator